MRKYPKSVAVDTGALVALLSRRDPAHDACCSVLGALPEATVFVSTEACLTEVLWLIPNERRFRATLSKLLESLDLETVPLDRCALDRIFDLQNRYEDLPMDFADATIVAACEKLDIKHVFTLDRKDFSIYRPLHARHFHLLP